MVRPVAGGRQRGQKLVIGGKSLGGRVASLVADELYEQGDIAGLVCLGYPFHPPGKPDQLRTAHLEPLQCPALIVQGERDPFGNRAEIEALALSKTITLLGSATAITISGPAPAPVLRTTEILRRPPTRLRHLPLSCRQRVDGRCRGTYGAPAPKFHDFGGTHSSEQHPHRSNRSPMNSLVFSPAHVAASADSRAWPFEEARRLIKRLERLPGGAERPLSLKPATALRGCRTSARSEKSRARRWCAMPLSC